MTAVQERVLLDLAANSYLDWHSHNDMINFVVPAENFLDIEESEQEDFDAGFVELLVIIEKDFLFGMMKRQGVKDPYKYLSDGEYSSDDAIEWYDEGVRARKVVMVAFNGCVAPKVTFLIKREGEVNDITGSKRSGI